MHAVADISIDISIDIRIFVRTRIRTCACACHRVCVVATAQAVQRAAHRAAAHAQHVGVDHRGADVGVAQQFLHGADVVTRLQQMGGKRMAQRVR